MAYRRRQGGITRVSTFKEDTYEDNNNSSSSSSLAAQAIRASAAHRHADSAFQDRSKASSTYDYTSMQSTNEPGGFWGVLARKAKAILDDDNVSEQFETSSGIKSQVLNTSTGDQFYHPYQSSERERSRKMDNPRFRKGLDALTSSLNHIGDSIGTALEEGRTIVENKTADIIQETRKLQTMRKGANPEEQNQLSGVQTTQETQLKASRDVAMATAAKAKVLLRELKTIKADLAFAKERCSQLEDENRVLREAREKGVNPEDDDMIRLQLETLLAEKARLAHENSIYTRENRFLREIVEYHQLTMQDVVYLDECIEEVTEVYPTSAVSRMLSVSPPTSPTSSPSPDDASPPISPREREEEDISLNSIAPQSITDVPQTEAPPTSNNPVFTPGGSKRHYTTST